ncbi:hypothetical protein GE09DRAFT_1230855 [Coniochaeta sp. 2T2.1]|nr:hypothetical protein GE09DRAFT_1230855 [Coniochaeta sp. 2T2.1]
MLSRHGQQPLAKVVLGVKAIALGLVAQLLMFGLEMAIELSQFPFPASILAMVLLFLFLLVLGWLWPGFGDFYINHLQQPANLVNRHMSIGFSVPIVMLARSPVASGDTIARLIACFITAGTVSAAGVYLMALATQKLLVAFSQRFPLRRQLGRVVDEEAVFPSKERPRSFLSVICAKLSPSTSDVSSAGSIHGHHRHSDGEDTEGQDSPAPANDLNDSYPRTVLLWILDHPLLTASWFSTILISLPLRYATGHEESLGISLLLAIWSTTQLLQQSLKTSPLPLLALIRPKLRTALSVACNPVLWTAIGLIAYAAAESHRNRRPIASVLSSLEHDTTFADVVMHRNHAYEVYTDSPLPVPYTHRPLPRVAAGDVANAILSAGLVCWGLKLWEYRRRLLSSAGFTILIVSCLAALANVVLGPLLAKGVLGGEHNEPGYDLAFVARTVTLALGAPAVRLLGGDEGVNAALVVVNGIVCQMAMGVGVGEWLGVWMGRLGGEVRRLRRGVQLRWGGLGEGGQAKVSEEKGTRRPSQHGDVDSSGMLRPVACRRMEQPLSEGESHRPTSSRATESATTTIASGVTVGINAAAMGTAHLYEAGSDAAPYSALAMTVFGVATVGLTMVPGLGEWVVAMVQ